MMFLKFQNKQQRFFYLLTTAVFISVVMVIWSYAWSKYFDLGANESREAVEIAGLSLLLQFFLCLPYFCFKRYIFTSLAITSIINGVYLYLYWMSSTPPCCGDMGQGLITMLYMFISGVYFVVSCGIFIDYLYSKKVQKNSKSS